MLRALLAAYRDALACSAQSEAAAAVDALSDDLAANFRVVRPGAEVVEQSISTE